MKIAVHQMCSGIEPARNCEIMIEAVRDSSSAGAVMYFAPEMSMIVDRNRGRAQHHIIAEPDLEFVHSLSALSAELGIWIHVGSIPVVHESGGKSANRSIIFAPDGKIRARYDKIHLFDVSLSTGENWAESSAYVAGDKAVAVHTPLGLMGLSICYDLRFPDLYSAYTKAGVDILAIPAAFTVPTGAVHWHILLRARAIEAESFVIAAAQSGLHADGRETYGHSMVVDPWGEILLDMGQGEALGFVDIDLTCLGKVRAQIPVRANHRDILMPVVIN